MTSKERSIKVNFESRLIWSVTVKRARILTTDSVEDIFFFAVSPNPSIRLSIATKPELKYYETSRQNAWFPEWHETKRFVLDEEVPHTLAISLLNNGQEMGKTRLVRMNEFAMNHHEARTLTFEKFGEVDLVFYISKDPKLRLSSDLCDSEKDFFAPRIKYVHERLPTFLNIEKERLYKSHKETPRIAVVASGGGLRAMAGFAGAMKAMQLTGILELISHISASGGSAWFLSRLYSDPTFPHRSTVAHVIDEVLKRIENTKLDAMLSLENIQRYAKVLQRRSTQKLPITLTDLFGIMIGDYIYGDRMHAMVTDQRGKLDSGRLPMPIYSALVVENDKSVKEHYDWLEITPFETGSVSLKSWIPTDVFGSKFSNGRIAKGYGQMPVHSLLGVWGNKFCMELREVADVNARVEYDQLLAALKELERREQELSELRFSQKKEVAYALLKKRANENGTSEAADLIFDFSRRLGRVFRIQTQWVMKDFLDEVEKQFSPETRAECETMHGACGVTHSFLRGGKISNDKGHAEASPHMLLADSGLALELPIPPVFRECRKADIIICFDFTNEAGEKFNSLQAAHDWAKSNNHAFPPIEPTEAASANDSGMNVFSDPSDKHCPVVLHFPLVHTSQSRAKLGDFKIFDGAKSQFNSNNFSYTKENFDLLVKLMELNVTNNAENIKRHIVSWFEHKA